MARELTHGQRMKVAELPNELLSEERGLAVQQGRGGGGNGPVGVGRSLQPGGQDPLDPGRLRVLRRPADIGPPGVLQGRAP
jgi:hypothetical protein